jgi:tyrosinase
MTHDHKFFAAMSCPTSVTWEANIKQMFTATDIAHMKVKGIDLSSYQDVMINAVPIYTQVSNGYMPPAGSGESPWSADWVNTFGCWIQQNCPEK